MIENRKVQWGAFIFFIVIFAISLNTIMTYGNDETSLVDNTSEVAEETSPEESVLTTPSMTDVEEENEANEGTVSTTEVVPEEQISVPDEILSKNYNFFFNPDENILIKDYNDDIDEIQEILTSYSNLNVRIEGHFNGYPNQFDTINGKRLSYERAECIIDMLKDKGIASIRLRLVNKGSTEQINKDNSFDELAKNRRVFVEFFVD